MPKDVAPQALSRGAFAILSAVFLVMGVGNTGLLSLMPVIGRSLGVKDFMIPTVFAMSSLMWAVTSPQWARVAGRRDRKGLILIGVFGMGLSMLLCGVVVSAGLAKLAPSLVILGFLIVARGVFGMLGSASIPASQAIVAERTAPERRTQAFASLAGAQGLGTVIGPLIAPLFILPVVGAAGPLYAVAAMCAALWFVAWRRLQRTPPPPAAPDVDPAASRSTPPWRDSRMRPFLLFTLVVAACQISQNMLVGFLVIDKLGLEPVAAQGSIALAMMFAALAGLGGQWGLIRIFRMTPRMLLRAGAGLAVIGSIGIGLAPNYWTMVAAFSLASLGFGFARPGAAAGASLAVGMHEQARLGGALAVVNSMTAFSAPLFVLLYEHVRWGPFAVNAAMLAAILVYAYRSRQLREATPAAPHDI